MPPSLTGTVLSNKLEQAVIFPLLIPIAHERLYQARILAVTQCLGVETEIDVERPDMWHFFILKEKPRHGAADYGEFSFSRLLKKSSRERKKVVLREIFGLGAVRGGYWGLESSHLLLLLGCKTHLALGDEKLRQPNEIVCSDGEDENSTDFGQPAHLHLREPADRLAPAETFLDAFAQPLADRIAEARSDLGRNGGLCA